MIPIWKDTIYSANGTTLIYTINSTNGTGGTEEIFSGKAYAYPNSNKVNINVNKICENYVKMYLPVTQFSMPSGSWVYPDTYKTFTIKNSGNTTLATYTFYWDWSYEDINTGVISRPINGRFCEGMYKLQSTLNSSSVTNAYNKTANSGLGYTQSACGEYAIYYINRYGGADAFLIENKVVEKDDYTINTFTTYLDGSVERENNRYMNEISHSWEISTGWLTDEQSELIAKHLFSSNYVYLHNLNTNTIIPVNITDTSVEYKTFKNERKLINYTIKLKDSNKKIIL